MARSIGKTLPAELRSLLSGEDLAAHEGPAFLLLSVTDQGWPHVAMVSVGELVAVGPGHLRVALYPDSTATRNLVRQGRGTIALVYVGAAYYIRCLAEVRREVELRDGSRLACFDLRVEDVLKDSAPYATLTSGVTFHLKDPSAVLPRWEEQVRALRSDG